MAKVTQLQYVNYEPRTDLIDPWYGASVTHPGRLGQMLRSGYEIVEPVMGWAPYTHLIKSDEIGYALVIIKE